MKTEHIEVTIPEAAEIVDALNATINHENFTISECIDLLTVVKEIWIQKINNNYYAYIHIPLSIKVMNYFTDLGYKLRLTNSIEIQKINKDIEINIKSFYYTITW